MERKGGAVYILANRRQGALYTGVTADLAERMRQHREGLTPGFATRYGIKRLMWFEQFWDIAEAIARETQIKRWNRAWKIEMIEKDNPDWDDLAVRRLGFAPLPFASLRSTGDGFPLARE